MSRNRKMMRMKNTRLRNKQQSRTDPQTLTKEALLQEQSTRAICNGLEYQTCEAFDVPFQDTWCSIMVGNAGDRINQTKEENSGYVRSNISRTYHAETIAAARCI